MLPTGVIEPLLGVSQGLEGFFRPYQRVLEACQRFSLLQLEYFPPKTSWQSPIRSPEFVCNRKHRYQGFLTSFDLWNALYYSSSDSHWWLDQKVQRIWCRNLFLQQKHQTSGLGTLYLAECTPQMNSAPISRFNGLWKVMGSSIWPDKTAHLQGI